MGNDDDCGDLLLDDDVDGGQSSKLVVHQPPPPPLPRPARNCSLGRGRQGGELRNNHRKQCRSLSHNHGTRQNLSMGENGRVPMPLSNPARGTRQNSIDPRRGKTMRFQPMEQSKYATIDIADSEDDEVEHLFTVQSKAGSKILRPSHTVRVSNITLRKVNDPTKEGGEGQNSIVFDVDTEDDYTRMEKDAEAQVITIEDSDDEDVSSEFTGMKWAMQESLRIAGNPQAGVSLAKATQAARSQSRPPHGGRAACFAPQRKRKSGIGVPSVPTHRKLYRPKRTSAGVKLAPTKISSVSHRMDLQSLSDEDDVNVAQISKPRRDLCPLAVKSNVSPSASDFDIDNDSDHKPPSKNTLQPGGCGAMTEERATPPSHPQTVEHPRQKLRSMSKQRDLAQLLSLSHMRGEPCDQQGFPPAGSGSEAFVEIKNHVSDCNGPVRMMPREGTAKAEETQGCEEDEGCSEGFKGERCIDRSLSSPYSVKGFKMLWREAEFVLGATEDVEKGLKCFKKNRKNEQYGRVLPEGMAKIFHWVMGMQRHHSYVDIGSGIGNTCLQAAYTVGCNAKGIECQEDRGGVAKRFCEAFASHHENSKSKSNVAFVPGKVELKMGDMQDTANREWLVGDTDFAFVNNFGGAFSGSSGIDCDQCVAEIFAGMKEGAVLVTLYPLSSKLGCLPLFSANKKRSMLGLESSVNASYYEYQEFKIGLQKNVVSWSEDSGCDWIVKAYRYTRTNQLSGLAVFLCNNPDCDVAKNNIPIPAIDVDCEGTAKMGICSCRRSDRATRIRHTSVR